MTGRIANDSAANAALAAQAAPELLWLGRSAAGGFEAAFAAACAHARVTQTETPSDAMAQLRAGLSPSLVVLARDWPGQWGAGDIDALRALAPLAPLVVVVGTWSDGEMRGGRQVLGAIRWRWDCAAQRLKADLLRLQRGQCPTFALPAAASEEELRLAECDDAPAGSGGVVAVCAADHAMWELLSTWLRELHFAPLRVAYPHPGGLVTKSVRLGNVAAAIFDATGLDATETAALEWFASAVRPAAVAVLLGFPRQEAIARAAALGATVLEKPFRLADLAAILAGRTRD